MTSCEQKSNKEVLLSTGIFSIHKLHRIKHITEASGYITGSLLFTISGSVQNQPELQFYWEYKQGEIFATSLQYSKLKFVIGDSLAVPTVEFVFKESFLNRIDDGETALTKNFNNLIDYSTIELAIVKLSPKDLEQEIYLPK